MATVSDESLDQTLFSQVAEAADILAQRFRADETAHTDGWGLAKHLELIGDGDAPGGNEAG